jgi:hypothetical protein
VSFSTAQVKRWLPRIVVALAAIAALYLLASVLLPHAGGVLDDAF